MQRLPRKGFLQLNVYPWFGYYPWECPFCREPMMVKKRHQPRKHRVRESTAD
jgi:hypothetical protein